MWLQAVPSPGVPETSSCLAIPSSWPASVPQELGPSDPEILGCSCPALGDKMGKQLLVPTGTQRQVVTMETERGLGIPIFRDGDSEAKANLVPSLLLHLGLLPQVQTQNKPELATHWAG